MVHRSAGLKGLSILLGVLVAGIFGLGVLTMRQLGLGWQWIAAGLLMAAMVAYERFLLRPEVFGYVVLMGQLCLLSRGQMGRRAIAGLVVLQLLLVNLHSYFVLGLGLTGAMAVGQVLRWLLRARGQRRSEEAQQARRQAASLAVALAAQMAVCFVNPWGGRLAAMPFQTLAFMRRHAIAGGDYDAVRHPWSVIGEFFRPFALGVFEQSKASYGYLVLLALAGAGMLAGAMRGHYGAVLIVAGMAAASLNMRRNIAPAALVIAPLALSACRDVLQPFQRRLDVRLRRGLLLGTAAALVTAGGYGVFSVITQRFYRNERRAVRFGLGVARTVVPVGAADWISAHAAQGRLWTDYNSSSNVMYFTRPHRDVPVLTNTWAYPPGVMQRVLDYSRGKRAFGSAEDAGGYSIVVLRMDRTSIPLGRALERDGEWALVYLDAFHVVFVRADGANAELARSSRITPRTLDLAAYKARLRQMDPVPSYSTYLGAFTLAHLGWDTQAVEVMDEVIACWPDDPYLHRVWNMKGTCLARRGTLRMLRKPDPDMRGKLDWAAARNCFLMSLQLRGDYEPAGKNLAEVERQIADEKRGILYSYPW
jgi:hypothetical protein